ncbi:MAG: RDD family protein [Psychroflexus sp.]|uniref:Uncharacterized protein n=1 Tax=Mesohalobacter halotolerans TaxID=1883405 RepID=A0A4U5TPE0_9FLAO|nr:RDD family protein [Psychroflexus sp.]TKS55826.1 hypothetical protein FCN74_10590 [Mesohalobacter halotolerans]
MTEKSRRQATLGKKALHLVIETCSKNRSVHLLKRNVFKYLPWEIPHTGIHWLFYYNSKGLQIPIGVWLLLIIPQIVVIGYFVSILLNKGNQGIYDVISQTTIACRINDVI